MKLFFTFLKLIIQGLVTYFVFMFYQPALDILLQGGLSKLVYMFLFIPIFVILFVITIGLIISLVIQSIIKFKYYWWLLLIELGVLGINTYIIIDLVVKFKA